MDSLYENIIKRVSIMSDVLDLSNLSLVEIPNLKKIISVNERMKVRVINLSNNRIKVISNLDIFKNVISINLKNNHITIFDPSAIPNSCKEINFTYNFIQNITQHYHLGLKKLNLKHNMLVNVSLLPFTNLKILNLSYNKYTTIDWCLPSNINWLICTHNNILSFNDKLYKIVDLDLSYNNITNIYLDYYYITINLSNNRIREFNAENLVALEKLNLSNNTLNIMPYNLPETLIKLNINNNQIKKIKDIPKYLEHLYAKNNYICNVNLLNSHKLTSVDLSNNNLLENPKFHSNIKKNSIMVNLKGNYTKAFKLDVNYIPLKKTITL